MTASHALGAQRPSHLIVFRELKEAENADAIMKILNIGQDSTSAAARRASVSIFQRGHGMSNQPLLYRRLGVAVADLNDDQVGQLSRDSRVQFVVSNQVRRLPPFEDLGAVRPRHALGVAEHEDGMTAYLRGMRDAAELALQFKTGAKARDSHDTAVKPEHSWCLDMIGVHSEYQTATGRGIKVAVLDTGLDFRHPDFRTVPDENTASYVVGEDAQDGHGHGTHCAGIIAGAAASTGGIRYGVAPNVELLVAKVLNNRSGEGYDDLILSAIDWAADMGARVISMSFGSPRTTGTPHDPVYEVYAKRLRIGNPGVLLIAAAGNGSNRPHSAAPIDNPAACPSIFAVGAIDRQKRIAPFSCCGGEKDHLAACAPGVAVHSAWVGGGFHVLSGTSMATPHVAAVAALHLEGSTSMNAGDLWQRLQETSVDLGPVADYGRGLVQAPAIQR